MQVAKAYELEFVVDEKNDVKKLFQFVPKGKQRAYFQNTQPLLLAGAELATVGRTIRTGLMPASLPQTSWEQEVMDGFMNRLPDPPPGSAFMLAAEIETNYKFPTSSGPAMKKDKTIRALVLNALLLERLGQWVRRWGNIFPEEDRTVYLDEYIGYILDFEWVYDLYFHTRKYPERNLIKFRQAPQEDREFEIPVSLASRIVREFINEKLAQHTTNEMRPTAKSLLGHMWIHTDKTLRDNLWIKRCGNKFTPCMNVTANKQADCCSVACRQTKKYWTDKE
jgi:hypothetical protein